MKCLGIPNTKHFHDITTIEDAKKCKAGYYCVCVCVCLGLAQLVYLCAPFIVLPFFSVYEKVKVSLAEKTWSHETEAEFEDSHGNVMSRRTYEDLARQGLL